MIPIGDETPTTRVPVVTWSLIALNVLIFGATLAAGPVEFKDILQRWGFTPAEFNAVTLITSMFLHGGFLHVGGNMLYLWIFGDNVEDALGHVGFLAFYFAAGVLAAAGQGLYDMTSTIPMVGASGAVSGVLGAHLLLFPHNRVRILWWFHFYVRVFVVRAVWALAIYFLLQILYAALLSKAANVAYWAHVAGFGFGLAGAGALMAAGVVARRKAVPPIYAGKPRVAAVPQGFPGYVDVMETGPADPGYFPAPTGTPEYGGAAVRSPAASAAGLYQGIPDSPTERIRFIREALTAGDVNKAVERLRLELRLSGRRAADPSDILSLGDAFYKRSVFAMAFEAWQAFLQRADASDGRRAEVKFRAGIVAARYLRDYAKAEALLTAAASEHHDEARRRAAEKEISAIAANLARTSVSTESGIVTGPCAVIRQTGDRVNPAEVGRVVAAITGQALSDVTRLVRGSVGFIATDVDATKALEIAAALQAIGVPVLIVPADKLVVRPEALLVRWAAVTQQGVELVTDHAGGAVTAKLWEEIFYVSAGRVAFVRNTRTLDIAGPSKIYRGSVGFGGQMQPQETPPVRHKEERYEAIVLDIFTLNPFQCYRCLEDNLSFQNSPQGGSPSLHANFVRLISDMVAFGENVPANEGVALVAADAPQRRWRSLTFDGIRDFEQYNYWRLQLEQYG